MESYYQDPQQQQQQQAGQAAPGESQETHLPILGLVETLEQLCLSDTPADEFLREVLRGFVTLSDAHYGAVARLDHESRQLAVVAELMPHISVPAARAWGPQLAELAAGVISQSIIRYRAVSEPAGGVMTGQGFTAVGFPLRGGEALAGCVTIVLRSNNPILSDTGVSMLRLLANFGVLYSTARSSRQFQRLYRSLSGAWDLVGETLAFGHPVEMSEVLVNRARTAFEADRVSIGFVKRDKVTIAAVSGQDTLDRRTNIVKLIRAAQTEVVISGESGSYHVEAEGEEAIQQVTRNPQHEALAKEVDAKSVYSIPLRKDQELVGVATFEFSKNPLVEQVRQVIEVIAGQMGPVLHLSHENNRGVIRRFRDTGVALAKWTFGKEHPWRKAAVACVLAILAFAVFGKCDFNVSGGCRLEPELRRIYSAPFDATIREAPVRPGDLIEKGQRLLLFDQDELQIQLRDARSKLIGIEKEMSTYLAADRISQYAEAKARRGALLAQVELLDRHLSLTDVKSDIDGIVLSGDLRQHIGRPVRLGEQLLVVAPLEKLVLQVDIAQQDISYVTKDQEGRFTTKAAPDVAMPFELSKILPAPIVRDGASVYLAEAEIDNPSRALRSGMEGVGKIKVDRRNVTWVASRKLVNWIQLHLWW